jgi:hypothetical protein
MYDHSWAAREVLQAWGCKNPGEPSLDFAHSLARRHASRPNRATYKKLFKLNLVPHSPFYLAGACYPPGHNRVPPAPCALLRRHGASRACYDPLCPFSNVYEHVRGARSVQKHPSPRVRREASVTVLSPGPDTCLVSFGPRWTLERVTKLQVMLSWWRDCRGEEMTAPEGFEGSETSKPQWVPGGAIRCVCITVGVQ